MIFISIVSHNHGNMVETLVSRLLEINIITDILITKNIPENLTLPKNKKINIIENNRPNGFGTNHNNAFKACRQPFFCILNPDIEIHENIFPQIIQTMQQDDIALLAPQIRSGTLNVEDNLRYFPTLTNLLKKTFFGDKNTISYEETDRLVYPDWVAGMFMVFKAQDFSRIQGFDERYFLYYEDVDICKRLQLAGKRIVADISVFAIHKAQRASHKNLRHMLWHVTSMSRYLWTYR